MESSQCSLERAKALKILRNLALFYELNEQELSSLLNISERRVISPGFQLMAQGEKAEFIWVVLSGEVEVIIDGSVIRSIDIRKGGVVGEVEFFNQKPCSASIVSKVESEALLINYGLLREMIKSYPEVGMKIYSGFTSQVLLKLKSVTDELLYLTIGDPSKQMAHDMRSPLAALKSLVFRLKEVPSEEKDLLDGVVERLDKIACTVLGGETPKKSGNSEVGSRDIMKLSISGVIRRINQILSEKRALYNSRPGIRIIFSHTIQSKVERTQVRGDEFDLQRILSNLIDNSVEAVGEAGVIAIELASRENKLHLVIQDSGKGIPSEVLALIGKSRVSFGKKNGNGLGLFHASGKVQSWGGTFQVSCPPKGGTVVTLSLPIMESAFEQS